MYFEANVTSGRAQGFNASFWVKRCGNGSSGEGVVTSSECQAGAHCVNGLCHCPHGFGGPQCDRPVCPGNCGAEEGRGTCNMVGENHIDARCIVQVHVKDAQTCPRFNLNLSICMQTLGLCVCTEGSAGSDCSSISDSDSLIWETLIDTQLSAVSF